MVIKLQEKRAPISNGKYVSGAKSSIGSPTFSRDINDEKSLSKLSAHSQNFVVPYTNCRTPIINIECVSCSDISSVPKKKSVRFMTDSCDTQKILCRTYTTNAILSPADRKERWYSSADIKRMRSNTYNEALAARSNGMPYLKQFQKLHSICHENTSNLSHQRELAHNVAASQYRGLESLTFVELMRLNQRQTLQEILSAQDDFRDLLTPEELMQELQALSAKLSHCSSQLAYMMGMGDADEADRIYATQKIDCTSLLAGQNIRQMVESHKRCGECTESSRYEI
jgi:hypothetical protein